MNSKRATIKMWGRRVKSIGKTFLWAITTLVCLPVAAWKALFSNSMAVAFALMFAGVVIFVVALTSIAKWDVRHPTPHTNTKPLEFKDRPIEKKDIDEALDSVAKDASAKNCIIIITTKNLKNNQTMRTTELVELTNICVKLSAEEKENEVKARKAKELLEYVGSKH